MTSTAELLAKVKARRALPPPAERRRIREAAGLAQADFAGVLGVTRAAIDHWERGDRFPGPRHLGPYSELLHKVQQELGEAA